MVHMFISMIVVCVTCQTPHCKASRKILSVFMNIPMCLCCMFCSKINVFIFQWFKHCVYHQPSMILFQNKIILFKIFNYVGVVYAWYCKHGMVEWIILRNPELQQQQLQWLSLTQMAAQSHIPECSSPGGLTPNLAKEGSYVSKIHRIAYPPS